MALAFRLLVPVAYLARVLKAAVRTLSDCRERLSLSIKGAGGKAVYLETSTLRVELPYGVTGERTEGGILLDGPAFRDRIEGLRKSLPKGTNVLLAVEAPMNGTGHVVTLTLPGGESLAVLPGLTSGWDPLPTENPAFLFGVRAPALLQALGEALVPAGSGFAGQQWEDARLENYGERLVLVSTDSVRLAIATIGDAIEGLQETSLPLDSLGILSKLVDAGDGKGGKVGFFGAPGKIIVSWTDTDYGAWSYSIRVSEKRFPNWRQIVPSAYHGDTTVQVEREALAKALKGMETAAKPEKGRVFLKAGPDGIELETGSPEYGKTSLRVGAAVGGAGVTLAFNGRFLRQWLDAVTDKTVTLCLRSSVHPATLLAGGLLAHLLMPINS